MANDIILQAISTKDLENLLRELVRSEFESMNEELQQMIYEDVSLVALRTKSKQMGMRTMREDGIRKVLAGITTAQEVLNVTVADSN